MQLPQPTLTEAWVIYSFSVTFLLAETQFPALAAWSRGTLGSQVVGRLQGRWGLHKGPVHSLCLHCLFIEGMGNVRPAPILRPH